MSQTALKYDLRVMDEGRVELRVPFRPGAHVTVFVVQASAERFDDLLAAAGSSVSFWDNPLDDEDWNDA